MIEQRLTGVMCVFYLRTRQAPASRLIESAAKRAAAGKPQTKSDWKWVGEGEEPSGGGASE
jgi:hypothetical protein